MGYNLFMASTILVTKLFVPPTRLDFIPRPRLIKRLSQGLHGKITLISAPAGFGKTTLVSEWIRELNGETPSTCAVWLSLDEGDNDLSRFLVYFISALQTIDADIARKALSNLQSPQPPPIERSLVSLINEIAAISDRILFVLDDYHLIHTQSVHDALSFLLDNLPPQMHMVIATREDPLLPLSRLRARGQMTELRAADLRFTVSEAAEFLNQAMGLDLSAEEIVSLETRTEGWVVGLQMAALSMQGRQDTTSFIQAFTGSHHFILDYLIEEVLQSQPEHVRNFLLQTSLLERLCGDLCNRVTGQEDSKATLETLNRGNLFLVPLDDERQWYRYHHLFSEVLQTSLMEQHLDQVDILHRRASEWYEQENLPSDAIRHAFAADDFNRAADLAELAWPDWSGSYQSLTWLSWLKELPDELVRTRPVLSVSYAWALLNAGNLEAAEAHLKNVECWMESEAPTSQKIIVDEEQFRTLPVSLATARAYHSQAVGNIADTIKYTRWVLDLLSDEDSPWCAEATVILGIAYWADGKLEAAYQTLSAGLAKMPPIDVIVGTFVLADIKTTLGQLQDAAKICEHALRLAIDNDNPLGTEDVYSAISQLHRERGDLEAATQDLAQCKALGDKVELPDWQYRYCIALERLNESQGNLDAALELLDEAERVFVRTPLPAIRPIAAMKARVRIKQDELAKAESWVRSQNLTVDDDLNFLHEFEHITLARLLIAQKSTGEAINLLERLRIAAEEGNRIGSLIEILALLALAFNARGDKSGALVHLRRALKLAEPEGFVQTFVDEGPPMAKLLYEALSQGISQDYVQRLLMAFPSDEPKKTEPSLSKIPKIEMVEPLSEREIEVLQLIAEGLTNQEIATHLYITLNTVKGHARNIYAKLGVRSRTQAVAKGKAIGILSPM